jgi:hypothetical protein
MVRTSRLAFGALGAAGAVAAVGAWNLYQRYTTPGVPYTVVGRVGDVELRRYPPAVLVETVATSDGEAFSRLFRYITGANEVGDDIAMTAPVEADSRGASVPMTAPVEVGAEARGGSIPMTAPVEIDPELEGIRMAFYLPTDYDLDSAPTPTDPAVDLVAIPDRTLAVRRFYWRPTDRRIDRETERLLEALGRADVPTAGEPFFLGYDAPWTLPFVRRNEVAVKVEADVRGAR